MLRLTKFKKGLPTAVDPSQEDKTIEVVVGVDAGSTQTRVCMVDPGEAWDFLNGEVTEDTYNALVSNVCVIPSTYAIVGDEREILPNSDALEDNYDSHIICIQNNAVKPLVGSERIVRGQKIKDASGLVTQYLDSSSNKMDNSIFYINILDGIGYTLLQRYNGRIPTNVNIHLIVSVRPKEMTQICKTRMNDNLIGSFVFRWQSAKIQLNIVDAFYSTEPEAQVLGTASVMSVAAEVFHDDSFAQLSEKLDYSDSYMHIEGGGSSLGVEVIKGGKLIDSCSSTFQLGGSYLARVIIDRIREVKGRTVSEEAVNSAISTCLLRNGKEREDITDIIAAAKNALARLILERVRHGVIDQDLELSLSELDFITLGGRLFSEDAAGQSIGDYFAEYLAQVSPNTEVIVLRSNYIPQGNMIMGINEYTDFAKEGDTTNPSPVFIVGDDDISSTFQSGSREKDGAEESDEEVEESAFDLEEVESVGADEGVEFSESDLSIEET